jgi:predicted glutamine amidotransferase
MCVIAAKPAGVKWPGKRYMKNCYDSNYDGAGLAWVDEGGLHVSKGYFGFNALWKDARDLVDYPVLLHCRLATHGSVCADNCHPFLLENGVALAHNGILGVELLNENMTDSESFAIKYVEPFSWDALRLDRVSNMLEMAIGPGNKVAMLGGDGQFLLLNGEKGLSFMDVWFSNDSCLVDTRRSWRAYYPNRRKAWTQLSTVEDVEEFLLGDEDYEQDGALKKTANADFYGLRGDIDVLEDGVEGLNEKERADAEERPLWWKDRSQKGLGYLPIGAYCDFENKDCRGLGPKADGRCPDCGALFG